MTVKMHAMVAAGCGGPEVLQRQSVPLGWPAGPGSLLVRLTAASVNPADAWFRALGPYVKSDSPLVLGHDGAGVVEAAGSDVTGFTAGDRVCFCYGGIGATPGTYAEFAVVPEAVAAGIPPEVDDSHAAALPLVAITAWEAMYDRAQVKPDEHVLVHAGAGGTGHMAIQLARLAGASVATTVSTPEKAAFVTGLGAQLVIDYRKQDFAAAALSWTQERGLDVALDNLGADAMQRTFRAMAPYGRVVTLMGVAGDDSESTAYSRNLTLHNLMMLTPMWLGLEDRLAAQGAILRQALSLLAAGRLQVHIAERFALSEVASAHARLEAGSMTGKIVLDIAS